MPGTVSTEEIGTDFLHVGNVRELGLFHCMLPETHPRHEEIRIAKNISLSVTCGNLPASLPLLAPYLHRQLGHVYHDKICKQISALLNAV
jgi:hypothetical protein